MGRIKTVRPSQAAQVLTYDGRGEFVLAVAAMAVTDGLEDKRIRRKKETAGQEFCAQLFLA